MKMIVMTTGIAVGMKMEKMGRRARRIQSGEFMNLRRFIGLEPYFRIQDYALRTWRAEEMGAAPCRRDNIPKSS